MSENLRISWNKADHAQGKVSAKVLSAPGVLEELQENKGS